MRMTFIRDNVDDTEGASRPRRKRPKGPSRGSRTHRARPRHKRPRHRTSGEILHPSDLVSLAVLGVVSEGCRTLGEIAAAARSIATCDWQPTTDLLAGSVTKAVEDGFLRAAGPRAARQEIRYRISSSGKAKLRDLLLRHSPRCRDSLGRASIALKICFLGVLDSPQAKQLLEDLTERYLDERRKLRATCSGCPASSGFAGLCIAREIQRLEQEQAWLESLSTNLPEAREAAS